MAVKVIDLLIKEDAEKLVYEEYLKKMYQVKRNELYEEMLNLNKEYDKFLNGETKAPHNVAVYLERALNRAREITIIEDRIHDADDEYI